MAQLVSTPPEPLHAVLAIAPEIDQLTLAEFMTRAAPALSADPVAALQAAERLGLCIWTRPEPPCLIGDRLMRRPATHMHEIVMLGVTATGDTERAAAAHWVTVARRILAADAGEVAA